jgi:hypothetical protein
MTEVQIAFLEANIENFETTRLGYVRNIPKETLQQYESIYKEYINADFVLTYWCSGCVLGMMKDLVKYYDAQQNVQKQRDNSETDAEFVVRKQKTKKKKDASN